MKDDFRQATSTRPSGEMQRVFPTGEGSDFAVHLARLAVLYEDLRIEAHAAAASAEDMGLLELISTSYRQQYFIRRGIATAVEFSQAIRRIRECPEMRQIEEGAASASDRSYIEEWLPAVNFFSANRVRLKQIRNDVGGHFGETATRKAFDLIDPRFMVSIEIEWEAGTERIRLKNHYVHEIVSAALLQHMTAEAMIDLISSSTQHAVSIVHFLVAAHLWHRLGR